MFKRSFKVAIAVACTTLFAMPAQAHGNAPAAKQAEPATGSIAGPITRGINHIGLTVADLDASVAFFVDGLGWRRAGGFPDYPSVFVTDGEVFVTLWRVSDPDNPVAFNRKTNVGLHHLALSVPDIETLDALHTKLRAWPGVVFEFGPEPNGGGPTIHMILREPGGNRIEFAVPGGRSRADTD